MKVMSFVIEGRESFGFVEGDSVVDIGGVIGPGAPDLMTFMRSERINALATNSSGAARYPLAGLEYLPTMPKPDKMFCIGLNYLSHVRETGREPPEYPPLFLRVGSAQVGHNQPMVRPKASTDFDYEGELAVIIGRTTRHVSVDDALSSVAGYTAFNDGSIRDWQRHTSQFGAGKNFYHSGSMGPWMVTSDEIPDPKVVSLETQLNGEVMQSAKLDDLVHGVPELIAYLSTVTILEPGDVIVTGTPGGVGAFRDPNVFMKEGDLVEVELSGIGILSNPIKDEK